MTLDVVILVAAVGFVVFGCAWLVHKTTLALSRLLLELFQ